MWIHKVVLEACPICSKETTLAGVEPHPTHPETELHTYRCVDCGLVKTRSCCIGRCALSQSRRQSWASSVNSIH
jgi:hypothetical protein